MSNIQLSKRLLAIGECVDAGKVVADIGCDHAYLPIWLVQNKICSKVYACDVRKGPLLQAKKNLEQYGIEDEVKVVLSDGLKDVYDDVQEVVIAGMGFETVKKILMDSYDRLNKIDKFIVEVNKDPIDLRRWINEQQYTIVEEKFIHEGKHTYEVIVFDPKIKRKYSEEEIVLGPVLMKQRSDEFVRYCEDQLRKLKEIEERANSHQYTKFIHIYEKYVHD